MFFTATFLLIENHRSFQILRRKRKHREKKKIGCAQKTQPMLLKLTAKRPCRYSKNAHQFSHIAPPALAALNFLSLVCLKRLINQSIKQTFKAAMYKRWCTSCAVRFFVRLHGTPTGRLTPGMAEKCKPIACQAVGVLYTLLPLSFYGI